MKGFPPGWNDLIMKNVKWGKVVIKVNDDVGPYFNTHQGLRQGDPLSPLLFDLATDALVIMINRAVDSGSLKSLASRLIENGLLILQYADDAILLLQNDLEQERNLKLILCLFEQMSGLKINFHKSEVICFGGSLKRRKEFEKFFNCKSGELPMKYLGIPIDEKRLRLKESRR
jgi:hypothetical protein